MAASYRIFPPCPGRHNRFPLAARRKASLAADPTYTLKDANVTSMSLPHALQHTESQKEGMRYKLAEHRVLQQVTKSLMLRFTSLQKAFRRRCF